MKMELMGALSTMEERVARGYSSIQLSKHRLTVGQGAEMSEEVREHLALLLRRARRRFNANGSLPPEVVAVAEQVSGQFWSDTGVEHPLNRAQAIHLLRQLRAEVEASRPSAGELFAAH
jgi:hypothetical protein